MKRVIRPLFATVSTAAKRRPVYRGPVFCADEVTQPDPDAADADASLFGDVTDIKLSGDTEKDFNTLVELLKKTSYPELIDALDDIVKDPKLYALFSEGFGNGELANVHMSSSPVAIPVKQLLPSQSEIGLDNSLKWALKSDCSPYFNPPVTIVAPVLTYRKTFIIDGHHRWSQLYLVNPNATISCINFNYNEDSPYRALRNFQGAVAVAQKDVPRQHAKVNNIYAMDESAIQKYITDNIQDVCWNSLVTAGVCTDKDSAIKYLTANAMKLKADNPPFSGAPDREYMPQTNEKTVQVAQEGQTNI